MKKYTSTLMAAALMCTATFAYAHDDMRHDGSHMDVAAAMDVNHDGMISQDEYINYYKAQWDKLPKNNDGMVMVKDMQRMHHDRMMKHDRPMKDDDAEHEDHDD